MLQCYLKEFFSLFFGEAATNILLSHKSFKMANNSAAHHTPAISSYHLSHALKCILSNYSSAVAHKHEPIILISTGAYNPVHCLHIKLFQAVKDILLAQHNTKVIAAFISPSHDDYLSSKLGSEYNPKQHSSANRLAMINLAISDAKLTDWLFCSDWECRKNVFVDAPAVVGYISEELQRLSKLELACKYLCGLDHVIKVGYNMTSYSNYGVVAVNRPGYELTRKLPQHILLISIHDDDKTKSHEEHQAEGFLATVDVSSTVLKQRLQQGKSIERIEFPSVIQFIRDNQLYGYKQQSKQ
jgi:nicotinate (nicotinamide) nucleotide adenylyltransferase